MCWLSMFVLLARLRGEALLSSPRAAGKAALASHVRILALLGGILVQVVSWIARYAHTLGDGSTRCAVQQVWQTTAAAAARRLSCSCPARPPSASALAPLCSHALLWLVDPVHVALDAAFSVAKYLVAHAAQQRAAAADARGEVGSSRGALAPRMQPLAWPALPCLVSLHQLRAAAPPAACAGAGALGGAQQPGVWPGLGAQPVPALPRPGPPPARVVSCATALRRAHAPDGHGRRRPCRPWLLIRGGRLSCRFIHGLQFQLVDGALLLEVRYMAAALQQRLARHRAYSRLTRTLRITYPDAPPDRLREEWCPICLETMRAGKQLPCSHVVHASCLTAWLQQQSSCGAGAFTCPLCRSDLDLRLAPPLPAPPAQRSVSHAGTREPRRTQCSDPACGAAGVADATQPPADAAAGAHSSIPPALRITRQHLRLLQAQAAASPMPGGDAPGCPTHTSRPRRRIDGMLE